MNVSEVINFKNDLERGHYISAVELIEIVETFNEGIKPTDLVKFLEVLDVFTMRLHPFGEYDGEIHYGYPEVDEKIGRKITNFLYLRANRAKDERLHNLYINEVYKLENICWRRADLLSVEGFVSNTGIVEWGKKHVLERMYSEIIEEQPKTFNALAENAQQAILKLLGLTQIDNNINRYAQQTQQPAHDKELHKKIAELEKQLSKFQAAAPDVVNIPFGKRLDFIDKNLPQSERIKQSYEIYSDNMSFHEDMHPVNTPDEMIKRIQGLLKVIKRKDSKILELEKQTNAPAHAQAEIDELKEQLSKVSAELTAANIATTAQPLDWQNMSEHVYPPELHLSLMIWQRIYADEELKESHPHITSHAGKFELIAKRMNLNPDKELGKRIEKITNIAYTKNGQTLLAVPLHAVKGLHMPPIKEKTTP